MKTFIINNLKIACVFCFFSAPVTLLAQQQVRGKIIDAIDSTPIAGATVFIAATTVSTISDTFGNYSITVPVEGSFDIVVSHVSYQRVSRTIDAPKPLHTIDFTLDGMELSGAIVTARSNVRQRDVNLFWRRLLGKLPSKNGLEVLNPEKVYFYRSRDNVLKVSSDEPIEIVNHEMGYYITYYLQSFEHKYRENETLIFGKPFFEEFTPQDNKQKEQWEKKRQDVYSVSLIRFFRALYHKKTREEGFLLVEADSIRRASTLFPLDKILQFGENKVEVSIKSNMYVGCINRYITDDAIENTLYTLTNTEQGYSANRVVVVFPPQVFSIYSDGSYSGHLSIHDPGHSMTGLSNTLPIDYK
ncbi:MAG: carboxypeptidase-like regulatory domain-containing protein [Bacteroidales bacterium]|nr:carboxypeptidase-like regulatory domain-containing protein [Bacteroidales bacterium]